MSVYQLAIKGYLLDAANKTDHIYCDGLEVYEAYYKGRCVWLKSKGVDSNCTITKITATAFYNGNWFFIGTVIINYSKEELNGMFLIYSSYLKSNVVYIKLLKKYVDSDIASTGNRYSNYNTYPIRKCPHYLIGSKLYTTQFLWSTKTPPASQQYSPSFGVYGSHEIVYDLSNYNIVECKKHNYLTYGSYRLFYYLHTYLSYNKSHDYAYKGEFGVNDLVNFEIIEKGMYSYRNKWTTDFNDLMTITSDTFENGHNYLKGDHQAVIFKCNDAEKKHFKTSFDLHDTSTNPGFGGAWITVEFDYYETIGSLGCTPDAGIRYNNEDYFLFTDVGYVYVFTNVLVIKHHLYDGSEIIELSHKVYFKYDFYDVLNDETYKCVMALNTIINRAVGLENKYDKPEPDPMYYHVTVPTRNKLDMSKLYDWNADNYAKFIGIEENILYIPGNSAYYDKSYTQAVLAKVDSENNFSFVSNIGYLMKNYWIPVKEGLSYDRKDIVTKSFYNNKMFLVFSNQDENNIVSMFVLTCDIQYNTIVQSNKCVLPKSVLSRVSYYSSCNRGDTLFINVIYPISDTESVNQSLILKNNVLKLAGIIKTGDDIYAVSSLDLARSVITYEGISSLEITKDEDENNHQGLIVLSEDGSNNATRYDGVIYRYV